MPRDYIHYKSIEFIISFICITSTVLLYKFLEIPLKGQLIKTEVYHIIIADDHSIIRSGLQFLVSKQPHLKIADEASSYTELVDKLKEHTIDLLILDLNMGDKNGLYSIKELSKTYPNLPILVLSSYPEEMYALQSIKAGAQGYLNKKVVSTEFIYAINTILERKQYLSELVKDELLYGTTLQKEEKGLSDILSSREFEVLSLMTSGMTYKEIAEQLKVSPKTVSTYRSRILDKLSLENTNQLIHFALQNNILA